MLFEVTNTTVGRPKGSKKKVAKNADPIAEAMAARKAMPKEKLGPIILGAKRINDRDRETTKQREAKLEQAIKRAEILQAEIDAGNAELEEVDYGFIHEVPGIRAKQIYLNQGITTKRDKKEEDIEELI